MMKKRQGCLEDNSAYTLIEVMLVLAIVSVVLIAAQLPLLEFHRIGVLEQQKAVLRGDFQRFLLMLKSELTQAGYALSSGSETAVEISTHSLVFKAGRNRGGDVADTRDKIDCRYDPETNVLDRKSGNAAYQTLIESIYDLKF